MFTWVVLGPPGDEVDGRRCERSLIWGAVAAAKDKYNCGARV